MSEQGEQPQPTLKELRIDPNSSENSLLLDIEGEQPAVESFIKATLSKIRARQIPPADETEAEGIRLTIEELFDMQRDNIDKLFKGGGTSSPSISTNWELRVYIRRDRQKPGVYHLNFHDNGSMQRVKAEGLELEK